jgi:uncharacterized membrane protein
MHCLSGGKFTEMPIASIHKANMSRLGSIDVLRGVVLLLMALDHTRMFFLQAEFSPTDLSQTTALIFFTRWITHFCAPVFIFLAGMSAFLYASKGRSNKEVAQFLFLRGWWLIILEMTVVKFGWFLSLDYHSFLGQVIWAIGWSMIALSGLVFLPLWVIMTFGITMIAGHNLFDKLSPEYFGSFHWLWTFLHTPGQLDLFSTIHLKIVYPLIPWIGVMAIGYGCGFLLLKDDKQRKNSFIWLGVALTVAFVVVRAVNLYGDPDPWSVQKDR